MALKKRLLVYRKKPKTFHYNAKVELNPDELFKEKNNETKRAMVQGNSGSTN